jgi:hypothetical protein
LPFPRIWMFWRKKNCSTLNSILNKRNTAFWAKVMKNMHMCWETWLLCHMWNVRALFNSALKLKKTAFKWKKKCCIETHSFTFRPNY